MFNAEGRGGIKRHIREVRPLETLCEPDTGRWSMQIAAGDTLIIAQTPEHEHISREDQQDQCRHRTRQCHCNASCKYTARGQQ